MDEYHLAEQIGEGSFGKVYLAKWRETTVAVKVLISTSLPGGGGGGGGDDDDDEPAPTTTVPTRPAPTTTVPTNSTPSTTVPASGSRDSNSSPIARPTLGQLLPPMPPDTPLNIHF